MPMIRWSPLAVAFAALLATRPAAAQFTVVSNPPGQVVIGCNVFYSVRGAPANPNIYLGSVSWTYWETAPNATKPFPLPGSGAGISTNEPYMGTYTVQAMVTYSDMTDPNNPMTYTKPFQSVITVIPPDDFTLPKPATQTFAFRGGQATFGFGLTAGGVPICSASGKVKENITNESFLGERRPPRTDVGNPNWLYFDQNSIVDVKYFRITASSAQGMQNGISQYNSWRPGKILWQYDQQLVLYLKDLAGVNQKVTLGRTFGVVLKKVDNYTVSATVQ